MPERIKITKCHKLVCNLYNKEKYVIHVKALKHFLKHSTRSLQSNRTDQEAWLKPYIDLNTELRTKAKNDFEKDLFKLMNNLNFQKTMDNVRKHRDIKLVTMEKISYLVSEQNFYTTKCFSENLLATEMKKAKVTLNTPVYLVLSVLDISKRVVYEYQCCKQQPMTGNYWLLFLFH